MLSFQLNIIFFFKILGAIDKNLELPLDAAELANQASKLLEEHDFTEVLNKIPDDAFNDLFVGKFCFIFLICFSNIFLYFLSFHALVCGKKYSPTLLHIYYFLNNLT